MPKLPRYYRKIIKIRGIDSPNVRFALEEKKRGLKPSGKIIVPGMLTYADYEERRLMWDEIRQTIGLDAEFYAGADVLLFAPQWLQHSYDIYADRYRSGMLRNATAMGMDPGEGEAESVWCFGNKWGVVEEVARRIEDTNALIGETIALARKHRTPPERIVIDRGGGGKQLADRMAAQGWPVRTMGFGETIDPDPSYIKPTISQKVDLKEMRYQYRNKRAMIFWELSEAFDPKGETGGFALSPKLAELRRQLAPFPRMYDDEGTIFLPPKKHKPGVKSKYKSLTQLCGCSPDRADALALMWYALTHQPPKAEISLQ